MARQIITERIVSNSLANQRSAQTWRLFVFLAGRQAKELLHRAFGVRINDEKYGEGFPKLDPASLMRIGVGPWTMLHAGLTKQERLDTDMTPFAFAIALLANDFDPNEALECLNWYHQDKERYHNTNPQSFWSGRLICPVIPEQFEEKFPEAPGLHRFGGRARADPFVGAISGKNNGRTLPLTNTYFGWLNEAQQLRARKYVNMGTLSNFYLMSKIHDGTWDDMVKKTARELLRKESKAQPNYHELTVASQIIDNSDLVDWLRGRKGVRNALFVVRPDATELQMTTGLRVLLNSDAAKSALIQRIARPLTPDEVADMRSPEIVQFLWEAPWSIIEKVSRKRDKVLASLMPHVGNVDSSRLRACLSPHKERKKRILPVTSDKWFQENFEKTDWNSQMSIIVQGYKRACELRKEVLKAAGNIYRAFLLILPSYTGEYAGNIDQVLGKMSSAEVALRRDFHKRLTGGDLDRPAVHSSIDQIHDRATSRHRDFLASRRK